MQQISRYSPVRETHMIQIPPYIGTRKVARLLGWWFLWPGVCSSIATCPSKYHLSVTFAWVKASLSQPTSSQWSDIMAPHNNPVAGTDTKHVSLYSTLCIDVPLHKNALVTLNLLDSMINLSAMCILIEGKLMNFNSSYHFQCFREFSKSSLKVSTLVKPLWSRRCSQVMCYKFFQIFTL